MALAIEKKMEEMTGKFTLSMCSTTAAQLCGLRAWMDLHKIPKGSEVIVSGLELSSGAMNCIQVGLVPVFADVDPDTLQPTIKTIQAARTEKTAGVLITHYAGYPCAIDDIWEWCKVRRYFLMDDASQCLSTVYKKWVAGGWPSDITLFSMAQGAVMCFKDESLAKCATDHLLEAVWKEEVNDKIRGYMAELQEADAQVFSRTLSEMSDHYVRRARVWDMYSKALESVDEATLPWGDSKGIKQSCVSYPLRLEARRDTLITELKAKGHQIPRPYHPIYKMSIWALPRPTLPAIEDFVATSVNLPIHPHMTMIQTQQIIDIVKRVLK